MKHKISSKLGLGTVQFGLHYGISNQYGKTPEDEVREILNAAFNSGIGLLDTAASYGRSEEALGNALSKGHDFLIVTKTPSFNKTKLGLEDASKLKVTFRQSLAFLGVEKIYGLMVHHADDLLVEGGEYLFEALRELQETKLVKKIGVSVYGAEQIDAIIKRYHIDLLQVPVNIFDQRLIKNGYLKKLKKLGIEIHARSVFLQGLLLMCPKKLPEYFATVRGHLEKFHADCAQKEISPLSACINFALNLNEIDRVIFGICSKKELEEIIDAINIGNVLPRYSHYSWNEELIINPAKWKVHG